MRDFVGHTVAEPVGGDVDALPFAAQHWSMEPAALIAHSRRDARTELSFWMIRDQVRAHALVPVWTAQPGKLPEVARQATHALLRGGRDASGTIRLIGNPSELQGGLLLPVGSSEVDADVVKQGLSQLVSTLGPMLVLYVPDRQWPWFRGRPGDEADGPSRWIMDLKDNREHFLASLRKSHRSVWLRTERSLRASGLTCEPISASRALSESSIKLIAEGKVRHGIAEPWQITRWRLSGWQREAGETAAWRVRDRDGHVVAVSLGSTNRDTMHMHEVGFDTDHPEGHLGYLLAMIHGPAQMAWESGVHKLDLAYDAEAPKRLRGATRVPTSHFILRCRSEV